MTIFLITKLTALSQIDTEANKTKCLKVGTVKSMIKDIVRGDSAIAELKLTQQHVDSLEKRGQKQDIKIALLEDKFVSCEQIVEFQTQKIKLLELDAKNSEKKLKREKIKNSIKTITSVGIMAVLGYLLIIK